MCLSVKSDKSPSATANGAGTVLGIGAVMLIACLAGPLLSGAAGALGAGLLVGAGGAVFAIALCVLAPAAVLAWRREPQPSCNSGNAPTPSRAKARRRRCR